MMELGMYQLLYCGLCGSPITNGGRPSLEMVLFGAVAYGYCPRCHAETDPKDSRWRTKLDNYYRDKIKTDFYLLSEYPGELRI